MCAPSIQGGHMVRPYREIAVGWSNWFYSVCHKFLFLAVLNPPKSPFFKGGLYKQFLVVPPFY